jgi:hypothetical protein
MAVAMAAIVAPALADSFNVTNCVANGVSITSWPTNSAGTNGLNQLTGGPISVANQEWAGFWFQCLPVAGSNSTVTVSLVRSMAMNPPAVMFNTNGQMTQCDWETPSNGIAPLVLTIPISGTNAITWSTNLDRAQIGGANWVGIYAITNSGLGSSLSNVVIGLNKKIIPIRYP